MFLCVLYVYLFKNVGFEAYSEITFCHLMAQLSPAV